MTAAASEHEPPRDAAAPSLLLPRIPSCVAGASSRPENSALGPTSSLSSSQVVAARSATLQKRGVVVRVAVGAGIHAVASAPSSLRSVRSRRRCIRIGERAESRSAPGRRPPIRAERVDGQNAVMPAELRPSGLGCRDQASCALACSACWRASRFASAPRLTPRAASGPRTAVTPGSSTLASR
jgi:hypothetical protein